MVVVFRTVPRPGPPLLEARECSSTLVRYGMAAPPLDSPEVLGVGVGEVGRSHSRLRIIVFVILVHQQK
jgi:hypothetical protein